MVAGRDPQGTVEVSLEELERCAHGSLAAMAEAMREALLRWPATPRSSVACRSGEGDVMLSATLGPMGALQQTQQRATAVAEETRRRLIELAEVYREADRRGAAELGGGSGAG